MTDRTQQIIDERADAWINSTDDDRDAELARLRAELAALAPLAEAAVACVDATAGAALWHKNDPFGPVMREAVRYVGKLRNIETEGSDARAQAQDGAA